MISSADGDEPAVPYYLRYLEDRPDSIVGALDDIATAAGPVLVHCAAGKDRTGVVVALALAAAGVGASAIIADYVRTGERIGAIMARLRASATYAADLEASATSPASRAPSAWAVLEVLDERYGGPSGWLAAQGFDPARLRPRLAA